MASQASGRPLNLSSGRASVTVEVVSRRNIRSLFSGKAVRQLFIKIDRIVWWELPTLVNILNDSTMDTGVTRYSIEREVATLKGGRLTIRVSTWVNGPTNHAQANGWLAGVMMQVLQNPKAPKADDTLDPSARDNAVLCGGIATDSTPLGTSEERSS